MLDKLQHQCIYMQFIDYQYYYGHFLVIKIFMLHKMSKTMFMSIHMIPDIVITGNNLKPVCYFCNEICLGPDVQNLKVVS